MKLTEKQIIEKIKLWLQDKVDTAELYEEDFCENKDDFISHGKYNCAYSLLSLIKNWES